MILVESVIVENFAVDTHEDFQNHNKRKLLPKEIIKTDIRQSP